MTNKAGTIERLTLELSKALEPIAGQMTPELILELGLQLPPSISEDPTLTQVFDTVSGQLTGLPILSQNLIQAIGNENVPEIISAGLQLSEKLILVFESIGEASSVFTALAGGLPASEQAALTSFAESFPRKLVDYSIVSYLESSSKLAVHGLALLGLIEWRREEIDPNNSLSAEYTRKTIRYDRLARIISDPGGVFLETYNWGSPAFDGIRLFEVLRNLIEEGAGGAADLVKIDDQKPILEAYLFALQNNVDLTPPGLSAEIRFPFEDELDFTQETNLLFPWVQKLVFKGKAGSNLLADVTPPLQVDFSTASGSVLLDISADLSTQQAIEPFTLIGVTGASRIEARRFGIKAAIQSDLDEGAGKVNAHHSLSLRLEDANVNMVLTDGDSFTRQMLSGQNLASNFNLSATWALDQGLVLQGSGGLELRLPGHADLGVAQLTNLYFKLTVDPHIQLEASAGIKTELGPLTAVIDRIGLTAQLSFQQNSLGKLGPVDLKIGFKPPSGIGLSIDGGGFKGGGFLDFEPEEESYSGMLELEYQDQFTLKAFGLLTTRLPNGQSGFSLLIVISSEFTPIQLGFGFMLNGVGGLLGLNRTVKVEPLRAGLRDNTLGSILFPTDIIANADRILSDLKQVFPPQGERFIFGPMAKITWGTPTLLTVDLGLVIEIPDPVRLLILGVVRGILPDEKASILRLQVNFLGEIDFERRQLSFDASLFDSKLLASTLTGDMAVRVYWGAEANLLLTVGGFHPAYQPPPMNLPTLRRLTLALLAGDNPRLTLEIYFAVTSNTAQFGARLELYAAASKFNVYGFLSFDVLFQFNPFYFVAEITAMLALRVGSSSIASVKLSFTLEGPTPWKAKGTASFKICWFFTLNVRFNKTFGESRNTSLPDLLVLPMLLEALSARDNWEGERPEGKHRLESLKEVEALEQVLVHPLGTLKISQKVAPLNLRIDRVGSQRPSDAREFSIQEVRVENTSIPSPAPAQESFAPAQFFDLNDEEKLASPSFKNFDSGIRVGDPDKLHTAYAAAREVKYELKYIDSQRDQRLSGPRGLFDIDTVSFNSWSLQGAISKSDLSFARNRKSSLAPEEVGVVQEPFAIVNTVDLKLFDESSLMDSEQAALARVKALIEADPALRGAIQVTPAFEINA